MSQACCVTVRGENQSQLCLPARPNGHDANPEKVCVCVCFSCVDALLYSYIQNL